jgi:hypothetical protein
LLPQQFYWDTSVVPGKIWAGVPLSVDPAGQQLVLDTALGGGPFLPLTGGTVTGPIVGNVTTNATTTLTSPFASHWTLNGTQTSGSPYGWTFDVVDNLDARPLSALSAFFIDDVVQANAGGGRNALFSVLAVTAPTRDAVAGPHGLFYNAIAADVNVSANQGGTAGSASANFTSFTGQAVARSGATYINILEAAEFGAGVMPGASVAYVNVVKASSLLNGIMPLISYNAYAIGGNLSGSAKFKMGFNLCAVESGSGNFSIDAGGTLIGSDVSGTVAHGVDLSAITCTADQFKGLGLLIDGVGNATFGQGIGQAKLVLNGGASSGSDGPYMFLQFGGVTRGGVTGYSAYFGGAYDSRVALCGVDGLVFSVANQTNTMVLTATGMGFNRTAPIAKPTGWGAPTGTATRATFVTSSVTLSVLAEHVKALIDDMTAYGLIGP